jgi:hypothetical protein
MNFVNAIKMVSAVGVAVTVTAATAGSAGAFSFNVSAGTQSPFLPGVTEIDFSEAAFAPLPTPGTSNPLPALPGGVTPADAPGVATYSGGAVANGELANQFSSPLGGNNPFLTTIGHGSDGQALGGPITLSFAQDLDYFGLYWGSIDNFNNIKFFFADGTTQTVNGAAIAALINPAATPNVNGSFGFGSFVNFFASSGESFNKIELTSGKAAFETDNHAYRAIPTPVLLPGLVAFGLGVLRKRKSTVSEEAKA